MYSSCCGKLCFHRVDHYKARQIANIVLTRLEPTLFIRQGNAMTIGMMPVPHTLLLKDHIQTDG